MHFFFFLRNTRIWSFCTFSLCALSFQHTGNNLFFRFSRFAGQDRLNIRWICHRCDDRENSPEDLRNRYRVKKIVPIFGIARHYHQRSNVFWFQAILSVSLALCKKSSNITYRKHVRRLYLRLRRCLAINLRWLCSFTTQTKKETCKNLRSHTCRSRSKISSL